MRFILGLLLLGTVAQGAVPSSDYETVAANQTAQVIGLTGTLGDILDRVVIIPTTLSPGAVTIIDGNVSIVVFNGGATSLTELKPIVLDLGMRAIVTTTPGFRITTGANVAVLAIGRFR